MLLASRRSEPRRCAGCVRDGCRPREGCRGRRPTLDRLRGHLDAGGDVVMPAAGIGTGLAQMATRAPACWAWICAELRAIGIENPADRG